jgi:hypothetical protein
VVELESKGMIRRAEPKAPQIPQDGQHTPMGASSPKDCERPTAANVEAREGKPATLPPGKGSLTPPTDLCAASPGLNSFKTFLS